MGWGRRRRPRGSFRVLLERVLAKKHVRLNYRGTLFITRARVHNCRDRTLKYTVPAYLSAGNTYRLLLVRRNVRNTDDNNIIIECDSEGETSKKKKKPILHYIIIIVYTEPMCVYVFFGGRTPVEVRGRATRRKNSCRMTHTIIFRLL